MISKNSQQKLHSRRDTRAAIAPYTIMNGPHFLGGMLGLLIAWLLRNILEMRPLVIMAVVVSITSSYFFLYLKKRLGYVQMSWRDILVMQLKGFLIVGPVFAALYYFGYFN